MAEFLRKNNKAWRLRWKHRRLYGDALCSADDRREHAAVAWTSPLIPALGAVWKWLRFPRVLYSH